MPNSCSRGNSRDRDSLLNGLSKILPIPLGSRVRYARVLCSCTKCYPSKRFFGQEGEVIAFLTDLDDRKFLKEHTYPTLGENEVIYMVRFQKEGGEVDTYPFRTSELEVV